MFAFIWMLLIGLLSAHWRSSSCQGKIPGGFSLPCCSELLARWSRAS